MEQEPAETEALRRRLYRPGASAADLATYLHVAEAAAPSAANGEPPRALEQEARRSVRPFVVGAVCLASAAVLCGLLMSGASTGPSDRVAPVAATAAPAATAGTDVSWTATFGPAAAGVLDDGERDHARGASVAEGPDRYRYTVANGDEVTAIAQRFQLCTSDVLVALPHGFSASDLPAGTTLELARLAEDGRARTC